MKGWGGWSPMKQYKKIIKNKVSDKVEKICTPETCGPGAILKEIKKSKDKPKTVKESTNVKSLIKKQIKKGSD
jgi:hypothetical protein